MQTSLDLEQGPKYRVSKESRTQFFPGFGWGLSSKRMESVLQEVHQIKVWEAFVKTTKCGFLRYNKKIN